MKSRTNISYVLRAVVGAALLSVAGVAVGATAHGAQRLDVNEATVEQLTELPGIGEAKAEAILAERGERPFSSVEDLERVKGIGPGLVTELRDHVSVGKQSSK